jgi:hypothetical protein
MNTGQTLLTIIAIVLLGSNVVSINRTFTQHGVILQQTEIGIFGISLGMSIVEEAQGRAFDENTIDSLAQTTNQLSSTLGRESGETTLHTGFDDFDDYNGWSDSVSVPGVDIFKRWATVVYVDSTNLDGTASGRRWSKRLNVFVKGTSSQDTMKLSYIFSYWSFR